MTAPPPLRLAPLVSGLALATAAALSRHPAPLAVLLVVTLAVAPRPRAPYFLFALVGAAMNGLFSWYGDTVLWRAPFTVALLGRPAFTVEALLLGLVTGAQVAIIAAAVAAALTRTSPEAVARLVPGAGARLATGLALRAAPDLAADVAAMRAAQAVRGTAPAGLAGAGHLLVPLVARSLDRSMTTLEVLYARGGDARPTAARPVAGGAAGLRAACSLALVVGRRVAGWWPTADLMPA
ncbi:MAG: hypothetical protein ACT4PT_08160, partial [Methanobacteriota archaeon]